jgi:hypothetical protein
LALALAFAAMRAFFFLAEAASHEAKAPLSIVELAEAWANIALDAPVCEPVPMTASYSFQLLGGFHNHNIGGVASCLTSSRLRDRGQPGSQGNSTPDRRKI